MRKQVLAWWAFLTLFATGILSAVPPLIDFQGTLIQDDGIPVTGTRSICFSLYTGSTGGTALWQETKSLTVTDGLYTTSLGSGTAFPADIWDQDQLWLGIRVGTDPELTPRIRLVAVPYAQRAAVADKAKEVDGYAGMMALAASDRDVALLAKGFACVGTTWFDPPGNPWRQMDMSSLPGEAWDTPYTEAIWGGGKLLLFQDMAQSALYSPATDSWVAVSQTNAPEIVLDSSWGGSATADKTIIWTPQGFLVFGFRYVENPDPENLPNPAWAGGLLNPDSNTWSPMDMTNSPPALNLFAPRNDTSLKTGWWIGNRLVVAGYTPPDEPADVAEALAGGIYNPATNSWTAMTTAGGPPLPYGENPEDPTTTVFETGFVVASTAELLVFGYTYPQDQPSNSQNVGYRFNPLTNTWASINMANCPSDAENRLIGEYFWKTWSGDTLLMLCAQTDAYGYFDYLYDADNATWHKIARPDGVVSQYLSSNDQSPAFNIDGGFLLIKIPDPADEPTVFYKLDASTKVWQTLATTKETGGAYDTVGDKKAAFWTGTEFCSILLETINESDDWKYHLASSTFGEVQTYPGPTIGDDKGVIKWTGTEFFAIDFDWNGAPQEGWIYTPAKDKTCRFIYLKQP